MSRTPVLTRAQWRALLSLYRYRARAAAHYWGIVADLDTLDILAAYKPPLVQWVEMAGEDEQVGLTVWGVGYVEANRAEYARRYPDEDGAIAQYEYADSRGAP